MKESTKVGLAKFSAIVCVVALVALFYGMASNEQIAKAVVYAGVVVACLGILYGVYIVILGVICRMFNIERKNSDEDSYVFQRIFILVNTDITRLKELAGLLKEASLDTLSTKFKKQLEKAVQYLDTKDKVLLITTSNRWSKHELEGDIPKSTRIAQVIQRSLGAHKCTLVDISKLKIHCCEGNVSSKNGNNCGAKAAVLKDKTKNPSGQLRCWASYNNSDDELWKVVTPLLESNAVVFLGSIRWGQTNAYYQKLIERLTWLENRWATLGERNILKDIESGFMFIGHNWNVREVVKTQKEVHEFFGFKVIDSLYFGYQYTENAEDESKEGYKKDVHSLDDIIDIKTLLKDE